MNKQELAEETAARTEMPKTVVTNVLNALLDVVAETVAAGETVGLVGFGTFETYETKPRTGINPLTKKPQNVPARRRPRLRFSKALKDKVAEPQ